MSLAYRIRTNIEDARAFGPSVVLRHLGRLKNSRMTRVNVPGVGPVHLRAGESDIAAVRQVFLTRDYATDWPEALGARIRRRYRDIVEGGGTPIIVDAGANIGAASLWFATQYPEARVVAVEPDPGNAAVLRKNLASRPNCHIMEAAIGAERGFAGLSSRGLAWAVQTERAEAGVPIVTVNDAFEASGGDVPFFVKIDIEGFENDLFASNTDWLARCYMVAIEPHDWMLPGKMTSRTFQQAMARYPFELFLRGENLLYVRV